MEWLNSVWDKIEAAFITADRWKLYLRGLGVTLEVAFFAALIGIAIGTVVAFMKISARKNGKPTVFTILPMFILILSEEHRPCCSC